jgi:hypothetical protein
MLMKRNGLIEDRGSENRVLRASDERSWKLGRREKEKISGSKPECV